MHSISGESEIHSVGNLHDFLSTMQDINKQFLDDVDEIIKNFKDDAFVMNYLDQMVS